MAKNVLNIIDGPNINDGMDDEKHTYIAVDTGHILKNVDFKSKKKKKKKKILIFLNSNAALVRFKHNWKSLSSAVHFPSVPTRVRCSLIYKLHGLYTHPTIIEMKRG